MDAQSGAEQLLSSILSASTPTEISSALSSTLTLLRLHPPDHCRPFFTLAFPALLSRLFFPSSPSSPAWIDLTEPPLLLLLSPSGPLLSTLLSTLDRHPLLYSFPLERLPLWIPHALPHPHSHHLSPLLRSRALPDPPRLHLSALEYYLLWFAYHPIARSSSPSHSPPPARSSLLPHAWTTPLRLRGRHRKKQPPRGLYPRLLLAYLRAFVPLRGRDVAAAALERAEFVVDAFVQFWMVDNDFFPVPAATRQSLGLQLPLQRVSGRAPPSPGLGEVLEVLVKYVNSGLIGPVEEGGRRTTTETMMTPALVRGGVQGENLARTWNSAIRRPLYRYILRSFLFCPVGTPMKNVREVVSLWMGYLEPWKIGVEEFAELKLPGERNVDGGSEEEGQISERGKEECGYSPICSDYVVSNYLFYSSLVVHFLGFAHKFLHTNVEMVVQMAWKVICILTSSRQLLDLLKEIDTAYHSKPTGTSSAAFSSSYKYIPSIREQLQDWEDGLCESEADGSFLRENWNCELKLFSESDDGAHQLLQLLILRAESELRVISSDNEVENLQNLESLRSKMNILFGAQIRRSHLHPVPKASPQLRGREDVFLPNHLGIGKQRWSDSKYQGDLMRRPISDSEVAWLARLMVRLSDWLNDLLGLNRNAGNDHTGPTYLDVPSLVVEMEFGAKEVIRKLLSFIGNCIVILAHTVLRFMRSHGWRINLRVLASKKIVMALLLYILVSAVRKIL